MRAFNKRKKKKPLFRLGKRVSFVSLEGITWSVKKKNGHLCVEVMDSDRYKSVLDRIILKQNHLR